jgi:competence protein ComEC
MNPWHQIPLLRLLFPFLLGIIAYVFFPYSDINNHVSFLIVLVFIVIISFTFWASYKTMLWLGVLTHIALFILGYQLIALNTEINYNDHFSKVSRGNVISQVRIIEPVIIKTKVVKAFVNVIAVSDKKGWIKTKGKALIYFNKDSNSVALNYGDLLLVDNKFIEVPPPANPYEFDYKKYLSYNNVFHQVILGKHDWFKTESNHANELVVFSLKLKDQMISIIKGAGLAGDELAVASALLVGDERDLNKDIISAYAQTGVIHILSVSGLHVGVIYLFLNWLLSFLGTIQYGKWVKASLLLLSIWFYCLLTGLSPSALRASTMLSLIIIGTTLNRNMNILNILAASAFVLLLINPYLLMNVGFQLSYLAVAGIVLIQPPLYAYIHFNNYIVDKLWAITSVSIAAQLATLPLCLFYFHQIPNYFLLSNIIAVPLSSLIIYIGIGMLLLVKLKFFYWTLSYALKYSLSILNLIVFKIQQLPYAVIDDIFISGVDAVFMYASIVVLCIYFIRPQIVYFFAGLSFIILLMFSLIYRQYEQWCKPKIIVYSIPKTTAIDFVYANTAVTIENTMDKNEARNIAFYKKMNNARQNMQVDFIKKDNDSGHVNTAFLKKRNHFIQFMDKRIILLDEQAKRIPIYNSGIKRIDYLIISNGFSGKLIDVCQAYTPKLVVFDSSVDKRLLNTWKEECCNFKCPYYAVADSGAWILNI